jgi:tetratricopeptide (TPR) repeat protein
MSDTSRLGPLRRQADIKARSGDPAGAIKAYDKLLSMEPGSVYALERKAAALVVKGDFESALECHNDLVAGEPQSAARRMARARVLSSLKRFPEAIDELYMAVALGGADAAALRELGLCLRRVGRLDEAIKTYRTAISEYGSDPDLLVALGDALLDAGLVKDAVQAFESASAGENPRFTEVDWITRGERLLSGNRYDDASTIYSCALRTRPNAAAWRGLAQASYGAGRYDEAIESTAAACKLDDRDAATWNIRGCAFDRLDRLPEALECFISVTRIDPESLVGWSNKALLLYKLEQSDEAVAACKRAIELSSNSATLWSSLSAYQLAIGDNQEALEAAERGLELNPAEYRALLNRSTALLALGRPEEALQCCDRALENNNTEDLAGWQIRARILVKLGHGDQAIKTLEEAVSKVRLPQNALRAKAQMLSDEFGRHAEALAVVEQARALDPESLTIACEYAELLLKAGRYAESRVIAETAIARETKPSRICAMRFVIFVSWALDGDQTDYEDSFQSFIKYYTEHFAMSASIKLRWSYGGLRAVIYKGTFPRSTKFVIETLIDLQERRIAAKDLSYLQDLLPA